MDLHCRRCGQDRPDSDFTPSMAKRPDRWCKPCTNEYRRDLRAGRIQSKRRVGGVCAGCGTDISSRPVNVLYCSEPCRYRNRVREAPWLSGGAEHWLQRAYGMSVEDKDNLLAAQKGRCAICGCSDARVWHVDHDHATGAIRGILCPACNHGLGNFVDDVKRLRAAVRYLKRAAGAQDALLQDWKGPA